MYNIFFIKPFTKLNSKKLFQFLIKIDAMFPEIREDDSIVFIAGLVVERDIIIFCRENNVTWSKENVNE